MDKRIIWFALIILVIAGAYFGYRFYSKKSGKQSAMAKAIMVVTPNEIFVGDSIHYIDNTPGGLVRRWDFGDPAGSPKFDKEGYYHIYEKGIYTVRLTVDNKLTDSIMIKVSDKGDPPPPPKVTVTGPDHGYVGEQLTYTDMTPGVEHTVFTNLYDYSHNKKDSKTYTTSFPQKGDWEITVSNEKNKGSDGQVRLKVHIIDRPLPPTPPVVIKEKDTKGGSTPTKKEEKKEEQKIETQQVQKPSVKKKVDGELTDYFRSLTTPNGSFRDTYPLVKKAVDNDESIVVAFTNQRGETSGKKLLGFCRFLELTHPGINNVKIDYDDAGNIQKINVTIIEKQ